MMIDTKGMVIARGRTAEVLAWQDQQVLKLFYDWVSAGAIEQESRAARLVSATNLPTPKMLGEVTYEGRRGLIYQRVAGVSLLNLLGIRPWWCVRYARQFAELQAAIHQLNGTGLPQLKTGLENTIHGIKGLPPGWLESAMDRLTRLPDGGMLCHTDFHPEQVMMSSSGQLVVLDWMTACAGQPAADVARTTVLLRFGPVLDASWLMRQLVNLLRGIFYRTYLHRYLELNPAVTVTAIHAWIPLVAMARLAENIPGEKRKIEVFLQKSFHTSD
jgi:hypothetical protein